MGKSFEYEIELYEVLKMSGIDGLLNKIRECSSTEHAKGVSFEHLMAKWLVTDPLQKQQYCKVQQYSDWAGERSIKRQDTGIDLVASLVNEEGFVAIQCKFYQPDHAIQLPDMDSFLSASSRSDFCRRVFIDTTQKDWGIHVQERVKEQNPPVVAIRLADLRKSPVDWEQVDFSNRDHHSFPLESEKKLRSYQIKVLEEVCSGFEKSNRGQMIMACGTGKTLVALKIAEKIAGKGKRVLFLAPSLSLVSQTMREWANDTKTALRSFAVCSDKTVVERKDPDTIEEDITDVAFPVITNAKDLANLGKKEDGDRMTVVFATYQSLDKVAQAQKEDLQNFDLIVCDEAHKTTGEVVSVDADKEGGKFTDIHNNDYVKGKKRLYMTATPRIYGKRSHRKSKMEGRKLYDMGEESIYGKIFSYYSFGDAVSDKMLTDYKVVVLQLDERIFLPQIQKWATGEDSKLNVDDRTKIIGCYKALQNPEHCYHVGENGNFENLQEDNNGVTLQQSASL